MGPQGSKVNINILDLMVFISRQIWLYTNTFVNSCVRKAKQSFYEGFTLWFYIYPIVRSQLQARFGHHILTNTILNVNTFLETSTKFLECILSSDPHLHLHIPVQASITTVTNNYISVASYYATGITVKMQLLLRKETLSDSLQSSSE